MRLKTAADRRRRNPSVEGRELSGMMNGQRKQVGIGDLCGRAEQRRIDQSFIERADVVRPEPTCCVGEPRSEQCRAAVVVPGPPGKQEWPNTRTAPFCTIGQVAQSPRPVSTNQSLASEWKA